MDKSRHQFSVFSVPLFRLLLINLAAGLAVAMLLVGGLLLLNPANLRELIFADHSPAVALALLLVSFFVTFGSTAMGTAIMAAGQREDDTAPRGPGSPAEVATAKSTLAAADLTVTRP